MRYHGFNSRDYFVSKLIAQSTRSIRDAISVMEIGVGSGGAMELVVGNLSNLETFCGVDISGEAIDDLRLVYSRDPRISLYALDVCSGTTACNKKFDIIYSLDTLEHVKSPEFFLNFMKEHLAPDGTGILVFPNESEGKHHGVVWFDKKTELCSLIHNAGLRVIHMHRVSETGFHKAIRMFLLDIPKSLLCALGFTKKYDNLPQDFQNTAAYRINRNSGIGKNLLMYYTRTISRFAAVYPFTFAEIHGDDISNCRLFLELKHG